MGKRTKLYGIDGCRGGWVVAEGDAHRLVPSLRLVKDLCSLFDDASGCTIAIDIPIGLSECEPRGCDVAARQLLRPLRSSSVFSPPARPALSARTFEEAQILNREALGVGMTRQCFCIMAKIRDVDALMSPERQCHVREVHPEVTF